MKLNTILAVWGKELTESLRDRRTLMTTLLLPTLVVPLLMMGAGLVAKKVVGKAKDEVASVMVIGEAESPGLREALRASAKLELKPAQGDWRHLVSEKKIRAVIEIPAGFEARLAAGEPAKVRIYHYEGELRSGFAVGELRRLVGEYRDKVVQGRLEQKGLSPAVLKPFEVSTENVAEPEKVGGNAIGGIIPYVFILFCFSGCMYPAIDLTAGEKERGTMETILSSPVGRGELVIGKFLTVLTAGLTTVVCSLLSLAGSLYVVSNYIAGPVGTQAVKAGAKMAGKATMPFASIDPMGLPAVVLLSLPLAACFAAGLLAVCLKAKSTKEAQSLVTPFVFVIILPAMMGMLPGVELNATLALVPVLNLALACKEVLSGVWHWQYLGLIFLSTCAYAALALRFCVRQFNREDVIFRM